MNIPTAIIVFVMLLGLLWIALGTKDWVLRTSAIWEEPEKSTAKFFLNSGRALAFLAALLLAVILVNAYVVRIPNPFEPRASSFNGLSTIPQHDAGPIGPLTVPTTNADPAAAAAHEKELLDKAKEQQPANLNK